MGVDFRDTLRALLDNGGMPVEGGCRVRTRCCFTGFRERIYVEGSSGYLFEKKGRGGRSYNYSRFPRRDG